MMAPADSPNQDLSVYIDWLGSYFANLQPLRIKQWNLWSRRTLFHGPMCSYEMIVSGSLTPPFAGPYWVLTQTDKLFTIDTNCQKEIVFVNRLKKPFSDTHTTDSHTLPAFTLPPQTPSTQLHPTHVLTSLPSKPYKTRSGQAVY